MSNMKKTKKFYVSVVLSATLVTLGTVTALAAGPMLDGKSVQQEPRLIQAQINNISEQIQSITMPTVYFVRANNAGSFPTSEITHSKEVALNNQNIQEIILPYGTFVREQALLPQHP